MGLQIGTRFTGFAPPDLPVTSPVVSAGMRSAAAAFAFGWVPPFPLLGNGPIASPLWMIEGVSSLGTSGRSGPSVLRLAGTGEGETRPSSRWTRLTIDPWFAFHIACLFCQRSTGEFSATVPLEDPIDHVRATLVRLVGDFKEAKEAEEVVRLIAVSGETLMTVIGLIEAAVRNKMRELEGQVEKWDRDTSRRLLGFDSVKQFTHYLTFSGLTGLLVRLKDGGRLKSEISIEGFVERVQELEREIQRQVTSRLTQGPGALERLLCDYSPGTERYKAVDRWHFDGETGEVKRVREAIRPGEVFEHLPFSFIGILQSCLDSYAAVWEKTILAPDHRQRAEEVAREILKQSQPVLEEVLQDVSERALAVRRRFEGLPRTIRDREAGLRQGIENLERLVRDLSGVAASDLRRAGDLVSNLAPHLGVGKGKKREKVKDAMISRSLADLFSGPYLDPAAGEILLDHLALIRPDENLLDRLWEEARRMRDEAHREAARVAAEARAQREAAARGFEDQARAEAARLAAEETAARDLRLREEGVESSLEAEAERLAEIEQREGLIREGNRGRFTRYREDLERLLRLLEGDLLDHLGADRVDELEIEEWIEIDGRTVYLRRAMEEQARRIEGRFGRALQKPLREDAGTERLVEELRTLVEQVRSAHSFLSGPKRS